MDHFSVSQLTTYLDCPAKYHFGYIERLPWEFQPVDMLFGTVCHQVIADFHQKQPETLMTASELQKDFEQRWDKATDSTDNLRFRSLNAKDFQIRGKHLMELYHQQFHELVPQDIELFFELPMLDLATGRYVEQTIQGRIDLVSDLTVYEIKTSGKSFTQDQADSSLQLTFYAWAHQFLYNKPAKGLKLIALVKTQKPKIQALSTKRNMSDFSRLYDLMTGVVEAIEKGVFYPNPLNVYGCNNCQFQQVCNGKKTG